MLQLDNKTPFLANIALFANEQAIDSLYVITKAVFNIGPRWTLAEKQLAPQETDIYIEEPLSSSLKHASDFHIGKAGTDIIMLGSAEAKDGQSVRSMDVGLRVGNKSKVVRVFGDRVWQNGHASDPQLFQKMPLIYERAYGGYYERDGIVADSYIRNPVGCGYLGQRSSRVLEGTPLPNLEDPNNLISRLGDSPLPACFAFVSPNWQPRINYAGTYDDTWVNDRAPFLPVDFNKRFLNSASPDLIYDGFLSGGEDVTIRGMSNKVAELNFHLPEVNLKCRVNVGGKIQDVKTQLETLIFEPNDLKLSMVWKSEFPCDKKIQKINEISLVLAR